MNKPKWKIAEVENAEFEPVVGLNFAGRIIRVEYYSEKDMMYVNYKIIGDNYYNCVKSDEINKIVDLCHRLEKFENDTEESIRNLKKGN